MTVRTIERDLAKVKAKTAPGRGCCEQRLTKVLRHPITGTNAAKAALNRCAEGATFGPRPWG